MSKLAVYAGSFDPVTLGHMFVIEEGARLFDRLVIGVGSNRLKSHTYTFTSIERMEMLREVTKRLNNVSVTSYEGLLIEFVKEVGAEYIFRGIRNLDDFNGEMNLYEFNASEQPGIRTVWLPASYNVRGTSSSVAKDIARCGGWNILDKYVDLYVAECLKERFGYYPNLDLMLDPKDLTVVLTKRRGVMALDHKVEIISFSERLKYTLIAYGSVSFERELDNEKFLILMGKLQELVLAKPRNKYRLDEIVVDEQETALTIISGNNRWKVRVFSGAEDVPSVFFEIIDLINQMSAFDHNTLDQFMRVDS